MELFRLGELVPHAKIPTFAEYAVDWWNIKTCKYVQQRALRKPITASTVDLFRQLLDAHLLPYFGSMPLDTIDANTVEDWILEQTKKGYKNATINSHMVCLHIMMKDTVRRKILKFNPIESVKKLPIGAHQIEILTPGEVRKLFPENWNTVWKNHYVFMANKLAAFTGMRIGELSGLRGEFVFDGYVQVCAQWCKKYGYTGTKTKKSRDIPITKTIREELEKLITLNGDGYLFSNDGGKTPLCREFLTRGLGNALECIGVTKAEQKRRGITMHSWRHYLNTTLRMANVSDSKIREVTGHSSQQMTDLYTHFNTREFTEVLNVQESMLEKPGKTVEATKVPAKPALIPAKSSAAKKAAMTGKKKAVAKKGA
jgi:integrase